MIPTKRLLWLLTAWLVLSVIASALSTPFPVLAEGWLMVSAALVLLVVADALAAYFSRVVPVVERRIAANLPVGVWRDVTLRFAHPGGTRGRLSFFAYDGCPAHCEVEKLPIELALAPGSYALTKYRFRPDVRGDLAFGRVALRIKSSFGFWEISREAGEPTHVRSFPNFAEITRYALLAVDNRLSQMGVLRRRRRGEGLDFHQLREYRQGDSLRQIDWKTTARMRKLISREYQDERDQQIVFLVDCGRRMSAKDGELSHFDHTLNAVLLLTYVALREGDSAGLMTFATDDARFVAPRKSGETVSRFLNALYALQPTLKTPDYYQAALDLSLRLKKRSLVVIVSNLRDEDGEGLMPALALLRRRHLVMFANLREAVIDETLNQPVTDTASALTYAAAATYVRDREALTTRMHAHGTRLVDVAPQGLAIALVNRYLDLKQGGVL
jgi:uncharacterized protein (DUF58 family)